MLELTFMTWHDKELAGVGSHGLVGLNGHLQALAAGIIAALADHSKLVPARIAVAAGERLNLLVDLPEKRPRCGALYELRDGRAALREAARV